LAAGTAAVPWAAAGPVAVCPAGPAPLKRADAPSPSSSPGRSGRPKRRSAPPAEPEMQAPSIKHYDKFCLDSLQPPDDWEPALAC
jgi:hypothetical protein